MKYNIKNLKIIWAFILSSFNLLKTVDSKGAFVLPLNLKLKDEEYIKYCHLEVNWNIDSISPEDLPKDFSSNAAKLVDIFRKKNSIFAI